MVRTTCLPAGSTSSHWAAEIPFGLAGTCGLVFLAKAVKARDATKQSNKHKAAVTHTETPNEEEARVL